ncbi:MAG: hypothetical protein KKG60_03215 [Nanoarchaeota archaeon]|nr:hypothetical protein [Nanoarchaeota archaeon]
MGKKKLKTFDILAWIAFGIVVLYFILKIIGIIQSPMTIDLIALISGAFFIGRYAQKIDSSLNDLENVKGDIRNLDKKCLIFKENRTKTK